MPEEQGAWEPVAAGMLNVGDRARGTYGGAPVEGVVSRHYRGHGNLMYVELEGDGRPPAGFDYARRWERWVPATPPADSPNATPPPAFAPPQVGEVFNRTYDNGDTPRRNCVVTRVNGSRYNDGWSVQYTWQGTDTYVSQVLADGTITSGASRGRFERVSPSEVQSTDRIPAPQVGEYFTRTFDDSGTEDRERCRVLAVTEEEDGWAVEYAQESGQRRPNMRVLWNGRAVDRRFAGTYDGSFQRTAAPAPVTNMPPLPEWATSLDAAKRYVFEAARDLERRGDNCYSGTNDFLSAAGLPALREGYPDPALTEESEIREFLGRVRDAAIETANDHGKSMAQVGAWLDQHGITEPPPALAEHTVTFQAPADANVRQVLLDLGWIVRD